MNKKFMKIVDLTKAQIEDLFVKNKSIRQLLKEIGVNSNGSGAYNTFRMHCKNIGILLENYSFTENKKRFNDKIDLKEILVQNSTYQNRGLLKKRLVREGLLEYVCNSCGNDGNWNGKKLVLQLEHKNGENNDNRLQNLCFLCPNCYSQSDTYSGLNRKKTKEIKKCFCGTEIFKTSINCLSCATIKKRKVKRPQIDILKESVEKIGYKATGRIYDVSDNTIRKWLKDE